MDVDILSLVPQIGWGAVFYLIYIREREYSKTLTAKIEEFVASNVATNQKLTMLIEDQGITLKSVEEKVNNLVKQRKHDGK